MRIEDINVDWSFKGANTKYCTHGLHRYPAMMIPQIPSNILQYYKHNGEVSEGDTLYDPFCGSGTSLVEARLNNLNAKGNDINPLACAISNAKSKRVNPSSVGKTWYSRKKSIKEEVERIGDEFESNGDENNLPERPEVLDGWFVEKNLFQLAAIRDEIYKIENSSGKGVARVFRLALSEATREVSYQRNGEFKRYRMSEADREEHEPDVWEIYNENVEDNITRVSSFYSMTSGDYSTEVKQEDSRDIEFIEEDSVDIVITSPPYGDHGTTVAYGQFSRDPAIVSSGYTNEQMRNVDKIGLGGKENASIDDLRERSGTLDETISRLEEADGRDEDALDFFKDYYAVMKEVNRVLKPDSPIVWVVANRTVSRINIPTHIITMEFGEHIGMELDTNIPREIPNKTMPLRNAPENIPGVEGDLMSDENIVVMRSEEN
jgi:DNA modification methylase